MSVRSTLIHLAGKAAIGLCALFLVGVLLAAIPNHRTPVVASGTESEQQSQAPAAQDPHAGMPGMSPDMKMDMADAKSNEQAAVHDMTNMHHGDSAHMHMTAMRPQAPVDLQRANEIAEQLRAGIEKYKDYHVALNEGFHIFLPNVPQKEYHFTSYKNGFLEAFTFDPSRPTSLLYKKTTDGYELVGAMYTMPKRATEDELNARVPLSVAMWHLHTNLCIPKLGQLRSADWTKFGLQGSIATEEACTEAGGRFHPVIFGWMTHVYPYQEGLDNIFAMHHHMD